MPIHDKPAAIDPIALYARFTQLNLFHKANIAARIIGHSENAPVGIVDWLRAKIHDALVEEERLQRDINRVRGEALAKVTGGGR